MARRTFGEWLRDARTARGMTTQADLRARLLERGFVVTRSAVSKWENDDETARPSDAHRDAIFDLFDLTSEQRDAVVLALAGRRGFPVSA